MHERCRLSILILGALALLSSGHAAVQSSGDTTASLRLDVRDESGLPVPGAEAMACGQYGSMNASSRWTPVQGTSVCLAATSTKQWQGIDSASFGVAVRAPGFAGWYNDVEPSTTPTAVRLRRGVDVAFQLVPPAGRPLPEDLEPTIYQSKDGPAAWSSLTNHDSGLERPAPERFSVSRAARPSPGVFTFRVDPAEGDLWMIVHHSGYLRRFSAGPFAPDSWTSGPIRISLPAPATLEVDFAPNAKWAASETSITLDTTVRMPDGGHWGITLARVTDVARPAHALFSDLAPERYGVEAASGLAISYEDGAELKESGTSRSITLQTRPVLPPIRVVDALTSKTLPDAGVIVISSATPAHTYMRDWREPDGDGLIRIAVDSIHQGHKSFAGPQPRYQIVARAPGYAVSTYSVTLPSAQREITVSLDHGKPVEVEFNSSSPLPDTLIPAFVTEDLAATMGDIPWTKGVSFLPADKKPGGVYTVRAGSTATSLTVIINEPGFLVGFRGSVPCDTSTRQSMKLPLPTTLTIHTIFPAGLDPDSTTLSLYAELKHKGDAGRMSVRTWNHKGLAASRFVPRTDDLAPGDYSYTISGYAERVTYKAEGTVSMQPGDNKELTATLERLATPGAVSAPMPHIPALRIVGPDGTDVSNAQIHVQLAGDDLNSLAMKQHGNRWKPDDEKNSYLAGRLQGKAALQILARAPGFAPATQRLELPTSSSEALVQLSPGKRVELKLTTADGRAVPDTLLPAVYDEAYAIPAWVSQQSDGERKPFTLALVERTGPGHYAFHVNEDTSGIYVLVNEPGFMQAFAAGSFTSDDVKRGLIEIKLPRPAAITAEYTAVASGGEPPSLAWMELARSQTLPPDRNWSFRIARVEDTTFPMTHVFDALAPGKYSVEAQPGSYESRHSQETRTRDSRSVTVEEGSSYTVKLTYKEFDPKMYAGPYSARVKILGLDGKPAAGLQYVVSHYSRTFGTHTVHEGQIPDSGVIELHGLAAGVDAPTSSSALRESGGEIFDYSIRVKAIDLGSVTFADYDDASKTYTPKPAGKTVDMELRLPPTPGDMAPDIELASLQDGSCIKLSSLRGKIVYIDFWATWCGPCQGPMAELDEVTRNMPDAWKGRVELLAASIDDTTETVRTHVRRKGWEAARQYWCAGEGDKTGWDALAAKTYGIRGVPTSILIGSDGKLIWRGHPSGNMRSEIDKAVSGK